MKNTGKALYLIRHCRASGQEPEAPLTEEGIVQAEELADVLVNTGIERIVSSPFARAIGTIVPFAQRAGLDIETDSRFAERQLSEIPLPNWLDCLRETFVDLDLCFNGGESSRTAMQRAVAALQDVLMHECQTTAIVSHGNLSTLLLKHFDDAVGFTTWQTMTVPDMFRITITENGAEIVRWPVRN